jgi:Fe-S-cluster containining protein
MREVTIAFVRRFTNSDPALLCDAREILARLTGVWRGTAGNSLPERYADLHGAVDAEIARIKDKVSVPIPCAKGCNHCCKFNEILITKYEGVLLVKHIENLDSKNKAAVVARILASTAKSGGGTHGPCVLLDANVAANGCSVYVSRPLPCRGYYSMSEPACNDRLNNGGRDPPNLVATRVVEFAALEVSNAATHPPYEVNTLLRRIYSDPAKIALWASGRPTDEPDLAINPGEISQGR